MYNIFLDRLILTAILFANLSLAIGCSNGSSNSTNNSSSSNLVITSPSSFTMEEGESLSFQIETNADSGIRFELLDSEDGSLFTLNENTGVLTSMAALNFEQPLDSDKDNVYRIALTATDNKTQTTTQTLSLTITDKPEFELDTQFPLKNGNLGGNANEITVRGKINPLDFGTNFSLDGLNIDVNEIQATLTEDLSWSAVVPVSYGLNALIVSFSNENKVEDTQTINIDNSYVPDKTYSATHGKDFIYYISVDGQQILSENLNSNEIQVVVKIDNFRSIGNCIRFSGLFLLNESDLLLAECDFGTQESHSTYLFSIVDQSIQQISISPIYRWTKFHLVEDRFLFFDNSFYTFEVFDLITDKHISIYVNSNLEAGEEYAVSPKYIYEIYETDVDFQILRSPYVDLSSITNSHIDVDSELFVNVSDYLFNGTPDNYQLRNFLLHYFDNKIFVFSLPEVIVFDESGNHLQTIFLEEFPGNYDFYDFEIISSSEEIIVLANQSRTARYALNLQNYEIEKAINVIPHLDFVGNEYDSNSRSIRGTSFYNREVNTIDLESLTAGRLARLDDQDEVAQRSFSQYDAKSGNVLLSYIWANQLEQITDTTAMSIYYPSENKVVPYFSLKDFHEFLNLGNDNNKYEFSNIVYSKNPNSVLFSVSITLDSEIKSAGVFSYSLNSNQFSTLFFNDTNNDESSIFSNLNPYLLSKYYEELNGHILTNWGNGKVLLLSSEGKLTTLFSGNQLYPITFSGRYNSVINEVYFGAIGYNPETNSPDHDKMYLVSISLDTLEQKVIASSNDDVTFKIQEIGLNLDTKNQLIYQIISEHIMVIDIKSNERLLVPFAVRLD